MAELVHSSNVLILGLIGVISNILLTVEAYHAAVVAYKTVKDPSWTADSIVSENVILMAQQIQNATNKTEIIVFPEYGLTTLDVKIKAKDHLSDYNMVLCEENINPCDNKEGKFDQNLKKLSCAIKNASIYTIVNVIERSNDSYYLTNVIFHKSGALLLKCRRNVIPPGSNFAGYPNQKPCIFTADFRNGNSTFLVIHDPGLLNSVPSTIDNVILTSAVENMMPSNYAPAIQAGYAVRNKVNLLAAGYFDFDQGFGGSGIYNINKNRLSADGTLGPAVSSEPNVVLFKEVQGEKTKEHNAYTEVEVNLSLRPNTHFPFENMATLITNKTITEESVKDFRCNFNAELGQGSIDPYKWVAFYNKTTLFDKKQVELIYCLLYKPDGVTTPIAFNNVTIKSTYPSTRVVQIFPIGINRNYGIPVFVYHESDGTSSVHLTRSEELISFGIIHVLGDPNSAGKISAMVPSVLLVVIALLLVY